MPSVSDGSDQTEFAVCAFSADSRSVSDARRFTRFTLGSWGLEPLIDTVVVIVSELLANALRHGRLRTCGSHGSPRPLWVGLLRGETTVLCTVADQSPDIPVLRRAGSFAQTGRGLQIIESLSAAWGWTDPNADGKAVWAAVPVAKRAGTPTKDSHPQTLGCGELLHRDWPKLRE
ncbi:ATP-binding protein [Streptomyces malaysiensis]|uniref:Signal transduction histidine kinase n=1 Tax=Streptomyces malaysiensis TaxID=92644 RepID=A0A7X6AXT6_STRMQ|nr:ATP-binding protein [Streptomyces malaysiensis]NIY65631.1 signal transduction histidine kinase [Streptomyces malaysiensis]